MPYFMRLSCGDFGMHEGDLPGYPASHGCIRLARPLDLADQVLRAGGVAGWNRNRIDQVVASNKNTVVSLQNPLPVHITYMTAWVDGDFVNFRPDIYGHDAKLLAALDGKSIAW